MKKLVTPCLLGFSLVLALSGCKHTDDKFISEGSIEFTASVVDQSNSMASLAPNKMIIKFKKNKSAVEMSAGMGLFSTSFVSDPQTKSLTQMVKLLNKKYWLTESEADIKKENESNNFEIKPTNKTKIIAGYNCQEAIVHSKDSDNPDFTIYYTKELDIQNPNFANPFSSIDGVLMEYQMKKFGLEMKFVAKTVTKDNVDDEVFSVPKDYKQITPEEMKELFAGMQ